jgi:HPt (histidine-containing phosphotransfer) domain-containing protein
MRSDETGRKIGGGKNPQIEGFNWQDGLNCFAGDEDVYLSIIRTYVDSTTLLLTRICDVTEETLADYAIRIHGIKGSSYGVRANEIGKQAEKLEHAAKMGNFQLVSQETPFFIKNAQKLLDALSKLFEADGGEADDKPERHAPDEALLEEMERTAANFNIDELEKIIKSLECFKYETQAELITWLRKKVNQMDFLAITERLAQRRQEASEG